jgi:hypothetical protein
MTESHGTGVCEVGWLSRGHVGSGHMESIGSGGLPSTWVRAHLARSVGWLPDLGDGSIGAPPRVMNSIYICVTERPRAL